MKTIALIFLALMISTQSVAQIITIDVYETQPFVKWKKTTVEDVLTTPEWTGYKQKTDCKYVIDLNSMTSTFYHNGKFVSTIVIEKVVKVGSKLEMTLTDSNLKYSFVTYETKLTVDPANNTSSYTWYNEYGGYTRTQLNTDAKITVSSKKVPL